MELAADKIIKNKVLKATSFSVRFDRLSVSLI